MSNIVVVTGSVRPNSVNEKVVPLVVAELEEQGATVTVADLKDINLPFFDAPVAPTTPGFEPEHESAKAWTQLVADADGVLFVTPEYNHSLSAVQSNAIDWIGKEWEAKPIALVGYGWTSGAAQAHDVAREALGVTLSANVGETQANLFIGKELSPTGDVVEAEVVKEKIAATVTELLENC